MRVEVVIVGRSETLIIVIVGVEISKGVVGGSKKIGSCS